MDTDGWSANPSMIEDILQVRDISTFLEKQLEKSVHVARRDASDHSKRNAFICGILGLAQLEQMIASAPSAMHTPVSIVERSIARPVLQGGGSDCLNSAAEAFSDGATLIVPGLEHRHSQTRDLCRQFDNAMLSHGLLLKHATTANAYVTPAQAQGFGIHYDNHCAIILQLHGSKSWTIYAPRELLPTRRCSELIADDDLGEVVMTVRLEPGDVLYVPRGFPHFATSNNDYSLHLTLGIFVTTWSHMLESIASDTFDLRTAVSPSPGDGLSATQFYGTRIIPAFGRIDIANLLQKRLAEALTGLPPLPDNRLMSLTNLHRLTPATWLTRSTLVLVMVQVEGDDAVLRCPGTRIALPRVLLPALEFVADNECFYVSDVPVGDAGYDRLELARLLIQRGVLTFDFVADSRDGTTKLGIAHHVAH